MTLPRPIEGGFRRYVAIGDSSTEGLDDPDGRGGYRGWADRFAELIAGSQGELRYANLAIRGRTTRQILEQQLPVALSMHPDLATVFSGTNDVVRRSFDAEGLERDIGEMQSRLVDQGARVLSFTLPDLASIMPLAALLADRVDEMNQRLRELCPRTGATLVDLAAHPVASDPRLWSADRLHANSKGHARMAAALAHAIGLPGADARWSEPLPEAPRAGWPRRTASELAWWVRFFVPWVGRRLAGRSSGDSISAKRPRLRPVEPLG